jgi:hypothetical protein
MTRTELSVLTFVLIVPLVAFFAACVAAGVTAVIGSFLVGLVFIGFVVAGIFEIKRLVDLP